MGLSCLERLLTGMLQCRTNTRKIWLRNLPHDSVVAPTNGNGTILRTLCHYSNTRMTRSLVWLARVTRWSRLTLEAASSRPYEVMNSRPGPFLCYSYRMVARCWLGCYLKCDVCVGREHCWSTYSSHKNYYASLDMSHWDRFWTIVSLRIEARIPC